MTVAAALGFAAAPARAAAPYPAIYAFGDSLSDAGNIFAATGGAEPVSPPYSHGRFSNGQLWVQALARAATGAGLAPSLRGGHDFAFGGAQSGQTSVHTLTELDLPAQLALFVARQPHPRAGALYAVWIGANDLFAILGDAGLTAAQVRQAEVEIVANEAAFVTAIAAKGAKNLVVVNVPDLGRTPDVTVLGPAASAAATALSADFNAKLAASMRLLKAVYGLHLTVVDSMRLIDAAVADPAAFGFADVTTRCWTGSYTSTQGGTLCSRSHMVQDTHLFWDGLHPTARGHARIGALAIRDLGLTPAVSALATAGQP